jgi:DNA-binding NarL/FixJ family response regulator
MPQRSQQPRVGALRNMNMDVRRAVAPGDVSKPRLNVLTRRQRDVLPLLVKGASNKEIGRALNLAEGTVKIHVAALFTKLRIHRRAGAALAAAQIFDHQDEIPSR